MPNGHGNLYNSRAWRTHMRRRILIAANYTCGDCGVQLLKGMHVHHRKELKRAPALGLEPQNLRPLCVDCHNRAHGKQSFGCDLDGNPLGDHPWNRIPEGGNGSK